MKLLWYGETPYIETGSGQIAKHLLPVFQQLFDTITLVPINQWWTQPNLPENLEIVEVTEGDDVWNIQSAKRCIMADGYDVLFLTTDINRIDDLRAEIEHARTRGVPVVIYAATDSNVYSPRFHSILELADAAVLYSNWSQRLVNMLLPDVETSVIYLGSEPDSLYPLSQEERRKARSELFGIEDDETFLVLNVNRNQVRKDLARSMAAFHLFHIKCPNSMLYMHAKQEDCGGNLPFQAMALGLRVRKPAEVIFCPEAYNVTGGCSRADLNRIYNAADVAISTATGEGWGLTTTEAMAAGTPFIGPNNTVFPEILGEKADETGWGGHYAAYRGLLVESGGPNLWAVFYGCGETPRELTSVTGMQAALVNVYTYREQAKSRAHHARQWTLAHTWMHFREQWKALLEGVLS